MLVPQKASDLVVRPFNFFNSTAASGPDGVEVGFFGLEPPPGRILLMTGFTWGVHAPAGSVVEMELRVTSGTPTDFHRVAPLSLLIPPGANAVVRTEHFPMPMPVIRGQYKHLCLYRRSPSTPGTIGVETHWLIGFWADDQ
jgi:hypothetical protein